MANKEGKIITETLTRLLAMREHSRHELLNKLLAKGLDAALCLEKINELSAQDIQSDQRFCESLIRQRTRKGFGEQRIRNELQEHRIDADTIHQCLADAEINWLDLGERVLLKKFGEAPPADWSESQKRKRFLQYRGFGMTQIQDLLD